jgi:hypothetical protein
MIFKALSKAGSLGSCFVCMDIGSSEWLTMQNLQISNTAETRDILKLLFPPRFSDKNRFTRPNAVLVAPISAKTKSNRLAMKEGGFLGVAAEGDREHFYSAASRHQQIHLLQTAPTQRS